MSASQAEYQRAVAMASHQLRIGDRVRVTHCGGEGTFTFKGWTGPGDNWLDTASGYDLHPYNISRINGRDVNFKGK